MSENETLDEAINSSFRPFATDIAFRARRVRAANNINSEAYQNRVNFIVNSIIRIERVSGAVGTVMPPFLVGALPEEIGIPLILASGRLFIRC